MKPPILKKRILPAAQKSSHFLLIIAPPKVTTLNYVLFCSIYKIHPMAVDLSFHWRIIFHSFYEYAMIESFYSQWALVVSAFWQL